MKKRDIAAAMLLVLGLIQPLGYFIHWPFLEALGFATAASPLPVVFFPLCDYEGCEADILIEVVTSSGQVIRQKMSPALYGKLQGPSSRRNALLGAFSQGPMLDQPQNIALREGILYYGLCNKGPLAQAFALPADIDHVLIYGTSKSTGPNEAWRLELRCRP